ncbi:ankyrin repeat-containing domain protein [Mycena galopus ATCC 62051]|nr:ankyrin repeat-containing domain protein [Mycena galopus ATCC 62051]
MTALAMAGLGDLPPELILHIVSFLPSRNRILDKENYLAMAPSAKLPQLVPDLPSINALSQTNVQCHYALDQTLYSLCVSVEVLGKLALLFAIEHQLERTFDRLIAVGVTLNTGVNSKQFGGWCTLLHVAVSSGHTAMVAKVLGVYGKGTRTFGELTPYARTGVHNTTALDYAARLGQMDIVKLLAAIPPPKPSLSRAEYLSSAFAEALLAGNNDICKILISEGADINSFSIKFSPGTPLSSAARTGNLPLVQFLLALGADPNVHSNRDTTVPLIAATRGNHVAIVQALVDGGAKMGNVLRHCPTVELLRFFLERGADPNAVYHQGCTALHMACMIADAKFAKASVELLLQFGATTVEKADRKGLTPVDVAIDSGYIDIVKLFEPLSRIPTSSRGLRRGGREGKEGKTDRVQVPFI